LAPRTDVRSVFGFLRLSTNRRVLDPPLSVEDALAHVERWLRRRHVRLLHPGSRHLEITFGLLRHLGTAANLTTDAQLAALAIEHQGELHSNDADFGRGNGRLRAGRGGGAVERTGLSSC
jgi:toxin-antitoxin system PIN domain toxin